jgi:hypothetical protein
MTKHCSTSNDGYIWLVLWTVLTQPEEKSTTERPNRTPRCDCGFFASDRQQTGDNRQLKVFLDPDCRTQLDFVRIISKRGRHHLNKSHVVATSCDAPSCGHARGSPLGVACASSSELARPLESRHGKRQQASTAEILEIPATAYAEIITAAIQQFGQHSRVQTRVRTITRTRIRGGCRARHPRRTDTRPLQAS